MKHFSTLIFSILTLSLAAQYTTPGTGEMYTMEDLVALSGGAVTQENTDFFVNEGLTIAETDTLVISNEFVFIATDTVITVAGGLITSDNAKLTSMDEETLHFGGIRFEETAYVNIDETSITYGGSLKVITPNFRISNSILTNHINGAATYSVLSFSNGKPEIINCEFYDNAYSAIATPANGSIAPVIEGCTMQGNVTKNSNRPQINLGPTGADTTFIRFNTIIGVDSLDRVGGISVGLLLGGQGRAVVEENTIQNNRYGINYQGADLVTLTRGNLIDANDNETNPMLGGSGISITGTSDDNHHVILGNTITGNLWGITLISMANANLGEMDDPNVGPGNNLFDNNGNGGFIYALYNNTANTQMAQGNCWILSNPDATLGDAEEVIFHQPDDETLGEVIFDPLGSCIPDATKDIAFSEVANLYPNPAQGSAYLELRKPARTYTVYDITGRVVANRNISQEGTLVKIDTRGFASGLYIVEVLGHDFRASTKLIVD